MAIAEDQTVICGISTELFAVKQDGSIRWHKEIGLITSAPVIDQDGIIYCLAGESGSIAALNINGDLLWQSDNLNISGPAELAIGKNNRLIICSLPGMLYSFDLTGHKISWQSDVTSGCVLSETLGPVLNADGDIYISDKKGGFAAYSASGSRKWKKSPSAPGSSPLVGDNGLIYLASLWGVRVIDPNSGTFLDTYDDPDLNNCFGKSWENSCAITSFELTCKSSWLGSWHSSVAMSDDGAVYAGSSENRNFYAIQTDAKGLEAGSTWPKYRADNQNTGRAYHAQGSGLADQLSDIPETFKLTNYPNPFNGNTNIRFELKKASNVVLKVIDIRGKIISVLINTHFPAGVYEASWNPESQPSGIYFYRLEAGSVTKTGKMIYQK